ncbi:unnamed protein product [Xylocopa violacea]|uniref:Uncharacterized protein n=1 Tax=Xylocopa violacea TaxID=135666 RepID=A0ABP1P8I0_XYLVO
MNDLSSKVINQCSSSIRYTLKLYLIQTNKVPKFPSVNDLKTLAEHEFISSYGLFPTCAVFAPGCLTLAGKSVDIAGNKTLSMKLAAGDGNARISDVLTSVIGSGGQIFALDARSLDVDRCHWNADVELVLIELANGEKNRLLKCRNADEARNREISIVTNMTSRWRTHPIGASMMDLLFSSETMETSKAVLEEERRVARMTDAIREERWDELGKLLWESHRYRSAHKYLSCLSNDIERTVNMLEKIEGVLGINVISYSASIVILVIYSYSSKQNIFFFLK